VSLLICTPCYGGMLDKAYFDSCNKLGAVLQQINLPHDWSTGRNESLVQRARMEMNAAWLRDTDYEYMMWIDADMGFEPDDVAKLWNLCKEGGADIAVGVYRMKKTGDLYAAWKDGKLVTDLDKFDGPTSVDFAGTGFMLISRAAAEGIHEYLKKRRDRALQLLSRITYDAKDVFDVSIIREMADNMAADYQGPGGRVPALYMCPIFNDGLESEDYHFSRIAREAGYPVIMDPSVRLIHWGKHGYGA
jgi:hypothetical protein